jgi:hypothetical protein
MDITLVRSLKIDLLLDHPNTIIEWFNSIWDNLHTIEANVYHKDGGELIYYIINDLGEPEWIFFQDNERYFWCNYVRYWKVLKIKLSVHAYFQITQIAICNLSISTISHITKALVSNASEYEVMMRYPTYANGVNDNKIMYALSHYINL